MKKKGLLSIDRISIYLVLFQYIPEIAILVSLGLVLIGFKPKPKEVLLIAVAGSLPFVLIRSLPLIPGTNVFIQLPILVALTTLICRLHFKHTALASLLGAIVIALAEKVFNFLTSTFTGISLQQAYLPRSLSTFVISSSRIHFFNSIASIFYPIPHSAF